MKLAFSFLWVVLVATLFSSCSNSWYCKRCLNGAQVKTDTIRIDTTIYREVVKFDTTVVYDLSTDTLIVEGPERVKIKFRDIPGPTAYLEAICPKDSVRVEIKVPVVTTVKTGFGLWAVIALVVGGLFVGALIMKVLR